MESPITQKNKGKLMGELDKNRNKNLLGQKFLKHAAGELRIRLTA